LPLAVDGLAMGRRWLTAVMLCLAAVLVVPSIASAAPTLRPVARVLAVTPSTLTEGTLPGIALRVDQRGGRSVRARLVVLTQPRGDVAARIDLGRIRTGRTIAALWPVGTVLPAGSYLVRLHILDAYGRTLLRRAHTTGRLSFTVQPAPVAPPPVASGVFPVAGPHVTSPAGSGGAFGAGRVGHTHEGHDISAAPGTPVVAPVSGTVSPVRFQASGAGWYVVLDGVDGRDYFFAHCLEGSVAVAAGAPVAAGQRLCGVGATGDATGPHLHFEIWEVGWRVPGGFPIDPLPQLLAWGG
jgi:murein DD-endopeptidase MepM/ murein hydrolase activator NlpD